MEITKKKLHFFFKNFAQGLLYLGIFAIACVIITYQVDNGNLHRLPEWMKNIVRSPTIVYLIYSGSEIFFGLFPPEFFMIWGKEYLKHDPAFSYWANVVLLAAISYGAGVLSFTLGRYLQRTVIMRYMSRNFFAKYWPLFRKYGSVLIVTAAMTPLPWSTISLLVGSTSYPMQRFLMVALTRLLRYGISAAVLQAV
ncbi:MAG: hypothetical protein LBR06_06040 [Bacteroidales bacterium]|jgi:membrane protein DedA with SNARE-associated domain|nr:hypothetical protein [Bacteroidales bacterium]